MEKTGKPSYTFMLRALLEIYFVVIWALFLDSLKKPIINYIFRVIVGVFVLIIFTIPAVVVCIIATRTLFSHLDYNRYPDKDDYDD